MIRLAFPRGIRLLRTRLSFNRSSLRLQRNASSKPHPSSRDAPTTHPRLSSRENTSKPRPYSGLRPRPKQPKTIRSRLESLVNHEYWHYAVSFGNTFAFCSLALLVTTHFVGGLHGVAGPSMLPTLALRGDWLVVSYLHPRFLDIQRGDLVSFESPMHPGERAIKRIIGMPGDLVLRDTPPGSPDHFWMEADPARWEAEGKTKQHGPGWMVRVPEGHCWVVGDNLTWSRDSRHFGALPLALVKGRVVARVAPWKYRQCFWRSSVYENVD